MSENNTKPNNTNLQTEAEKPKADKVEITKEVQKPAKENERYPDFGFGEQSF